MKLKFKHQAYQADAVRAVVDCFQGQPKAAGIKYTIDPGRALSHGSDLLPGTEDAGFANAALEISQSTILSSLQAIQREQRIPISEDLKVTDISKLNLDIEMETGTSKTYCYIKTMFELNAKYGWSKFIIVVPTSAEVVVYSKLPKAFFIPTPVGNYNPD